MSKDFNTTAAEIIARYQNGERLFDGVELPDGDSFAGVTLAAATFRNAWLFGADFTGADLRGAIFENANVKCVDFSSADLRHAQFRSVVLCGSKFSGARIAESRVFDASFYGADITSLADFAETVSD